MRIIPIQIGDVIFDWYAIMNFARDALNANWGWIVLGLAALVVFLLFLLLIRLRQINKKLDLIRAIALKEGWSQFD